MATVNEQTIDIRELATKTVVFYPQKAEITRELIDVKLKPGVNEINIVGITPIADESSIKVEANGSTTVTDMLVELIPNPDSFEDVYISDSKEASEASDDSESDKNEKPKEIEELEKKMEDLKHESDAQNEIINSSTQSLSILEKLMNKMEFKKPEELEASLIIYQDRRQQYYDALAKAKASRSGLDVQLADLSTRKFKLQCKHDKAQLKADLKKQKAREKRARAKAKEDENKQRDLVDKAKFWPKKVYKLKVTIELSVLTPGTSRRGSFESLATANTVLADHPSSESSTANLLLTYMVLGAYWTPKYDLSISTITETGILNYRAEIRNSTSETWREAKVTLSTSRATFSGVSEPIPVIKPWMLQLVKAGTFGASENHSTWSIQERNKVTINMTKPNAVDAPFRRHDLFGVPGPVSQQHKLQDYQMQLMLLEQQNKKRVLMARQEQDHAQVTSLFGSANVQQQQQPAPNMFQQQAQLQRQQVPQAPPAPPATFSQPPGAATFGAPAPSGGFGSSSLMPVMGGLFGSMSTSKEISKDKRRKSSSRAFESESSKDESVEDDDEEVSEGENPATPPADADWEESGLTTTLELRGLRTIPPSSSERRFKIATVRLNQLGLTHIVVPKLKAEAFLRARIVNTSPSALLQGSAGLTVDRTFLGQTTLPRCSAGENFPLPLGVDPAISVSYPAPVTRKNLNTGVFTKEHSSTYTRSVILTNTRGGGAAINIIVKDQVPVSEDERLKVEILAPRGLQEEGDKVKTGTEFLSAQTAKIGTSASNNERDPKSNSSSSKSAVQAWGQAIAKLNKSGAIEWTVALNPGKSVRLNLEYTVRYPSTERPTESVGHDASPFKKA